MRRSDRRCGSPLVGNAGRSKRCGVGTVEHWNALNGSWLFKYELAASMCSRNSLPPLCARAYGEQRRRQGQRLLRNCSAGPVPSAASMSLGRCPMCAPQSYEFKYNSPDPDYSKTENLAEQRRLGTVATVRKMQQTVHGSTEAAAKAVDTADLDARLRELHAAGRAAVVRDGTSGHNGRRHYVQPGVQLRPPPTGSSGLQTRHHQTLHPADVSRLLPFCRPDTLPYCLLRRGPHKTRRCGSAPGWSHCPQVDWTAAGPGLRRNSRCDIAPTTLSASPGACHSP